MKRYKISGGHERPVAADVLEALGWAQTKADDWDLWWDLGAPDVEQFRRLRGRRYNHLPGLRALGHKDGLHQTLLQASQRQEARGRAREFAFAPRTFLIPEDEAALHEAAAREPWAMWIEKPRARARGEGVRVLPSLLDAHRNGSTLVQRYLSRPHLIDGFKYSLRCYVLITSLRPLVAWFFDDGFVKLASRPFTLDRAARTDRFRHLTNPDVLKLDAATPVSSRNTTHQKYRQKLAAAGVDEARLWRRIHALAARTVAAAQAPMWRALQQNGLTQDRCFELYGLDVMVDADLRPSLIEVNITPSLAVHADASSPSAREEMALKTRVVQDTFRLADLEGELGRPPAIDAPLADIVRHHEALLERRGGYEPLVPGPEPFELLPLLGACGAPDLALALRGRKGSGRSLQPRRAKSFPLDGGLVVQSDCAANLLVLDPEVAAVWAAVEEGQPPEACVERLAQAVPDLAERAEALGWGVLAEWSGEGAIAPPAPAPVRARPARGEWNRRQHYQLDGLRFSLQLAERAWEELVAPTLLWARRHAGGEPQAIFEVRKDSHGMLVEDEHGFQLAVSCVEKLPAAVHQAIARRTALAAGLVGVLRALVVEHAGRRALLLGVPDGWQAALSARTTIVAREPALQGGETLQVRASRDPAARALPVELVGHAQQEAQDRAALLEQILGARLPPPPPLSDAGAGALVAWLRTRKVLQLATLGRDQAVARIAAALGGEG